ncbi:MAG TPA: hypothetical protein VLI55_00935 [Bryobacteraceae bacterium]|nr:hypothetical protein [Bryobacteraceae bacterium]
MTLSLRSAKSATRAGLAVALLACASSGGLQSAENNPSPRLRDQVLQHESEGDLAGARSILEQEAPSSSSASEQLAEFLERHNDSGSRDAYRKWATEERDPAQRKLALRQLVLLDFMQHKDTDLTADLKDYRDAGGDDLVPPAQRTKPVEYSMVTIPGPLSSFARMAALSTDLAPEDLLPALARNVVTNGYEASGNELLQQTEYLRLLVRYIGQARELQAMANKDRKIVIPTCDSDETGNLLKVLGYRMRGSCGGDIVLETVNATRAFLTVDSAFPLTQLEQDLRANHRFELPYAPTPVPVLYNAGYWMAALNRGGQTDFIDAFLSDPSLCRLYLGLSHLDRATAEALRKQAPPGKLKIYAHVLDFYGGMFQIRNGAAVTPGPAKIWGNMVGASPGNPGAFFEKLISTDDGWMASYFDALSRIRGPAADYLTQPDHLKRYYEALRGKITSPGPARPVFRSSTELMLLTTSLRIDPNGQPHIPGDLAVWRNLFIKHPNGKYDGKLTRSASSWRTPDDFVEALFGLSRKSVENEPLKMFLALNDIDRGRAKPMSPALATRLVNGYRLYGAQYAVFADAPGLSEDSIQHYMDTIAATGSIRDSLTKADAVGTLQSLVELWRILCRQGSITRDSQDASFAKLISPFAHVRQETEVFDAGRSGIALLLADSGSETNGSQQEALMQVLVGKLRTADSSLPGSPAENFARVFDAQRLISLDALFTAADRFGKGPVDPRVIRNLTGQIDRLEEAESLRGSLSGAERNSYTPGYWGERHISQERKVNLENLAKGTDKRDPRGVLAPFLRDSLVGILYAYYAPDGAELLITNPLFVRSHDFIGPENIQAEWRQTQVAGSGWPESGGGRLVGSLVSLPYALAEAEQNFLTPKREQALIWGDLVPQMIVDVTVNRWRNVSPEQLRWVAVHIQRGRTLLAAAALNGTVESKVMDSLRRYETPGYTERVDDHLRAGDFADAISEVPPSVLYALAQDPALRDLSPDVPSAEIATLEARKDPGLSRDEIARTFGTPKPTLTHSYQPGLLYLRTFPALMGYSSRILAETWESNNLYYAALAEEAGIPVSQLDAYVPEWNKLVVENIFATHLEDWPALLRSLHVVAGNVMEHRTQPLTASNSLN